MKKFTFVAVALAVSLGLAAPAVAQSKDLWGTIIGGGLGGWGGSKIGKGSGKTIATIVGTLFGAAVGNGVGQSLNNADTVYNRGNGQIFAPRQVYQQPRRPYWRPSNVSSPYPNQPRYAQVQQPPIGRSCPSNNIQRYQTVITINGREVPAWGYACYVPNDGSFRQFGGVYYR